MFACVSVYMLMSVWVCVCVCVFVHIGIPWSMLDRQRTPCKN